MLRVYRTDLENLAPVVVGELDGELCLLTNQGVPEAVAELKRLFPKEDAEPGEPGQAVSTAELQAYAAGSLRRFSLPLRLAGSAFQQRVWRKLCEIPYGELWSYRDLAKALGTAPRAVGQALAANPIAIVVPCHRVVAADGSIGGYSGGLELKRRLLELEGIPAAGLFHQP